MNRAMCLTRWSSSLSHQPASDSYPVPTAFFPANPASFDLQCLRDTRHNKRCDSPGLIGRRNRRYCVSLPLKLLIYVCFLYRTGAYNLMFPSEEQQYFTQKAASLVH